MCAFNGFLLWFRIAYACPATASLCNRTESLYCIRKCPLLHRLGIHFTFAEWTLLDVIESLEQPLPPSPAAQEQAPLTDNAASQQITTATDQELSDPEISTSIGVSNQQTGLNPVECFRKLFYGWSCDMYRRIARKDEYVSNAGRNLHQHKGFGGTEQLSSWCVLKISAADGCGGIQAEMAHVLDHQSLPH